MICFGSIRQERLLCDRSMRTMISALSKMQTTAQSPVSVSIAALQAQTSLHLAFKQAPWFQWSSQYQKLCWLPRTCSTENKINLKIQKIKFKKWTWRKNLSSTQKYSADQAMWPTASFSTSHFQRKPKTACLVWPRPNQWPSNLEDSWILAIIPKREDKRHPAEHKLQSKARWNASWVRYLRMAPDWIWKLIFSFGILQTVFTPYVEFQENSGEVLWLLYVAKAGRKKPLVPCNVYAGMMKLTRHFKSP